MLKLTSLTIVAMVLVLGGCGNPIGPEEGLEAGLTSVEQQTTKEGRKRAPRSPSDTTQLLDIDPSR